MFVAILFSKAFASNLYLKQEDSGIKLRNVCSVFQQI